MTDKADKAVKADQAVKADTLLRRQLKASSLTLIGVSVAT